ncbi:MAG: aldo/keto reductase [Eggerthellaceae bacterium]|jgi:predicted aldo/keto reductase-like oxidoreductase
MDTVTLGSTGMKVAQNQFGALPIQRISKDQAVALVRRAYDGGMRFFDTARAYSDSEEKLGAAFDGMRDKVYIASKTMAKTPEEFWKQLDTSLANLHTDYLDLYQFHCVDQVWAPGDGTGMYECMLQAKEQGKIRHIGVTAHKLEVAFDLVNSGLYETLQYPFSYLASEREHELVALCKQKNVGFLAMKGMAGGLITRSDAAMAYIAQFDNVLPIWGIQRESELDEWLSYFKETPQMTPELQAFVAQERTELAGNFCRGCGYCLPCTADIMINQCARMSLMLRRAPSKAWLTPQMQDEMAKIQDCTECGICMTRCPYGLDIPNLLKQNYEDYQRVLAGEVHV